MEFFGVFLNNEHIQSIRNRRRNSKNGCIYICTQHYNNCIREQQIYKKKCVCRGKCILFFRFFFRECFNVDLTSVCPLGVSRGRTFRLTGGHRILDILLRRHSRRCRHQRLCPFLDCPGMGF